MDENGLQQKLNALQLKLAAYELRARSGIDAGVYVTERHGSITDASDVTRSVLPIAFSLGSNSEPPERSPRSQPRRSWSVEPSSERSPLSSLKVAGVSTQSSEQPGGSDLRARIAEQNEQIRHLEEVVERRTIQVEQLSKSMTDFRQNLFDADSGATEKKIAALEYHLEASRRHEMSLEAQMAESATRISELYAMQCALAVAQERSRLWELEAIKAQEAHACVRRAYARVCEVLAVNDEAAREANKFTVEPVEEPMKPCGTQTDEVLWDLALNQCVVDKLREQDNMRRSPTSTKTLRKPRTDPEDLEDGFSPMSTLGCCTDSPNSDCGHRRERQTLLFLLRKERRLRAEADRKIHELLAWHLERASRSLCPKRANALVQFGSVKLYDFSLS